MYITIIPPPTFRVWSCSAFLAFIYWCDDSFLDLNVTKTMELVFDFRRNCVEPKASSIYGEDLKIVKS